MVRVVRIGVAWVGGRAMVFGHGGGDVTGSGIDEGIR